MNEPHTGADQYGLISKEQATRLLRVNNLKNELTLIGREDLINATSEIVYKVEGSLESVLGCVVECVRQDCVGETQAAVLCRLVGFPEDFALRASIKPLNLSTLETHFQKLMSA